MLNFSIDEYKNRIAKTKKRIEEEGFNVLFTTQPGNMYYLTGYDGWSFYVPQGVIVSLDKEDPIWIGRAMDASGTKLTTFLKDEDIKSYADDYVQSITKHPMEVVANIIKEKGWANKTIAVEMDQYYFTHRSYMELEKSLPQANFKDSNLLVNKVRMIKSDKEIEYMKIAGKIAVKVMQTAIDSINVGVRDCDAAANVASALVGGTDKYCGDWPTSPLYMMAGERSIAPHLIWCGRKYEDNDTILLELCGAHKRYHTPIARTVYLGNPSKKLLKAVDTVIQGLNKTLAFIKPGVTCEEVEAKWREAISHSGIVKESRLGYSIGCNYPPSWNEGVLSLRPGDKTILQPNMTLHVIPFIWQEDFRFEIDASIRITENGYEHLFDFPVKLFTKP